MCVRSAGDSGKVILCVCVCYKCRGWWESDNVCVCVHGI